MRQRRVPLLQGDTDAPVGCVSKKSPQSHLPPQERSPNKTSMPQSRELANKKNDHKDRQSRGRAGSDVTNAKKGGAGAHNWGVSTSEEGAIRAMDRNDPNYDSSEEGNA